jgi:hypothetical protein
MIPTAATPLVRECVREAITMVSEDIDRAGVPLSERARRLVALSDLLDLIGWEEDEEPTESVDATAHALTLREVASPLLEMMSQNLREYEDDDPDKPRTWPPHGDPQAGARVAGRRSASTRGHARLGAARSAGEADRPHREHHVPFDARRTQLS